MVDKLTTAMGMAGVGTTTKMEEISPAPPIGSTWDLTPSPAGGNGQFVIGNGSPNEPTITKSFTVSGELEAEVRVYGAGGGPGPSSGPGHGGRVRGIYKFKPGKTYYISCGGAGQNGPQGAGGGGASALWIEPEAAGVELLVAGGGGGGSGLAGGVPGTGKPVGQHPFYAFPGAPGVDPGSAPGWPNSIGESGGRVTPTTGGRAGTGRRTGEAGGDAPRGYLPVGTRVMGGRGTNVPETSGPGGVSGYAGGGSGSVAPGDQGGGGGGGGYAGGGGGNNDSAGFGGGGGNGYTHPSINTNVYNHPHNGLPEDAQAGTRSWPTSAKANGGIFWGDPSAYGAAHAQGIVKIILKEDGTP